MYLSRRSRQRWNEVYSARNSAVRISLGLSEAGRVSACDQAGISNVDARAV